MGPRWPVPIQAASAGPINPDHLAGEVIAAGDGIVDAAGLAGEIVIPRAEDDPGVWRPDEMQASEIPAVDRENGPAKIAGATQDGGVANHPVSGWLGRRPGRSGHRGRGAADGRPRGAESPHRHRAAPRSIAPLIVLVFLTDATVDLVGVISHVSPCVGQVVAPERRIAIE